MIFPNPEALQLGGADAKGKKRMCSIFLTLVLKTPGFSFDFQTIKTPSAWSLH